MKIKAVVSRKAPKAVHDATDDDAWCAEMLVATLTPLGVTDALDRPSEFYVQDNDVAKQLKAGVFGVEVRLSGVSRLKRKSEQFTKAVKVLFAQYAQCIAGALDGTDVRVQLFVSEMINGDVQGEDGTWSPILEVPAQWITKDGVEAST